MNWTKEQEACINVRGANALVSAAAGSGKTAVLVQRIIELLTGDNPIKIEELLVVTFTKAAANGMKTKIFKALRELLKTDYNNQSLIDAINNISRAKISTIDSFCNKIVKENYLSIDIEPSFRILSNEDTKIQYEKVLDEVIEKRCNNIEDNTYFYDLVAYITKGKADTEFREIIINIYEFYRSQHDPEAWVEKIKSYYSVDDIMELPHIIYLMNEIKSVYNDANNKLLEIFSILEADDVYYKHAVEVCEQINKIEAIDDYSSLIEFIQELKFKNIPRRKKNEDIDNSIVLAKNILTKAKDAIKGINKLYSCFTEDIVRSEMVNLRPYIIEIINLVEDFHDELMKEKRYKNAYSFNDIAHFALEILMTKDNEEFRRTNVAIELSKGISEIFIDEYQDSNYLQEYILRAVSREEDGHNNIFMVGDIKQSIYSFRHARPELFSKKFKNYTELGNKVRRVLSKNFRSRDIVINDTNEIFSKIMVESIGGIRYDENQALKKGRCFLENKHSIKHNEIITIENDTDDSNAYVEGQAIAGKIAELLNGDELIYDSKLEEYRKPQYKDIVILLRSIKDIGVEYANALQAYNIPVHLQSKEGFFASREVSLLLGFLKVIDNPLIDIEFTGILYSDFVGASADELVVISETTGESMYDKCMAYINENNDELAKKIMIFLSKLNNIRSKLRYQSVHNILEEVLEEFAIMEYFTIIEQGKFRRANLNHIRSIVLDYEKTEEGTIAGFIEYVNSCTRFSIDIGEIMTGSEEDNVVRIMTIHKSKGLEFPIVFIGGVKKKINRKPTSKSIIYDLDFGLGIDSFNYKKHRYSEALMKKIIKTKLERNNLGEFLRLLYVAMTRAEEKIIFISANKTPTKEFECDCTTIDRYSDLDIMKIDSYYKIIQMCDLSKTSFVEKFIMASELLPIAENASFINSTEEESVIIEEVLSNIKDILSYKYPNKLKQKYKKKYSVSELKLIKEDNKLFREVDEEEKPKYRGFGSEYGTAIHDIMRHISFVEPKADIDKLIKLLSYKSKKKITPNNINSFFESELYKRAKVAEEKGLLFREEKFLLYDEQGYLLQGMIDAYFFEDNKIILYDYKTDNIKNEQRLIELYKKQLELYAKALNKIYNVEHIESYIYSFSMKKSILVSP